MPPVVQCGGGNFKNRKSINNNELTDRKEIKILIFFPLYFYFLLFLFLSIYLFIYIYLYLFIYLCKKNINIIKFKIFFE